MNVRKCFMFLMLMGVTSSAVAKRVKIVNISHKRFGVELVTAEGATARFNLNNFDRIRQPNDFSYVADFTYNDAHNLQELRILYQGGVHAVLTHTNTRGANMLLEACAGQGGSTILIDCARVEDLAVAEEDLFQPYLMCVPGDGPGMRHIEAGGVDEAPDEAPDPFA